MKVQPGTTVTTPREQRQNTPPQQRTTSYSPFQASDLKKELVNKAVVASKTDSSGNKFDVNTGCDPSVHARNYCLTPSGSIAIYFETTQNGSASSSTPAVSITFTPDSSSSTTDAQTSFGNLQIETTTGNKILTSVGEPTASTSSSPYTVHATIGNSTGFIIVTYQNAGQELLNFIQSQNSDGLVATLQSAFPSPSTSPTQTPSRSATLTPSQTPSPSISNSSTRTISATASPTTSPTSTMTPSTTATASGTLSSTQTPTPSVTPSNTPTPSSSETASTTVSPTQTPTPSVSSSSTETTSPTATTSLTATISSTATASTTVTPSGTPSSTQTPTVSATPSNTQTTTPSITPTATPTSSRSATTTQSTTLSVTPSSTRTPSATSSSISTRTPSITRFSSSPIATTSFMASASSEPSSSSTPSPQISNESSAPQGKTSSILIGAIVAGPAGFLILFTFIIATLYKRWFKSRDNTQNITRENLEESKGKKPSNLKQITTPRTSGTADNESTHAATGVELTNGGQIATARTQVENDNPV
ncbi:MAG: hypothetical protein V4591_08660 [Bdellovibrionota bacterium]